MRHLSVEKWPVRPDSRGFGVTGTLQADGYAGYDQVYEGGRVKEAGCMAHVRRKFYDLYVEHKSPVAAETLARIAGLYGIEKESRGRSPDEGREVRNARAQPLLDLLKQWLEETLGKLSRKSETAGNPQIRQSFAVEIRNKNWLALGHCRRGDELLRDGRSLLTPEIVRWGN